MSDGVFYIDRITISMESKADVFVCKTVKSGTLLTLFRVEIGRGEFTAIYQSDTLRSMRDKRKEREEWNERINDGFRGDPHNISEIVDVWIPIDMDTILLRLAHGCFLSLRNFPRIWIFENSLLQTFSRV